MSEFTQQSLQGLHRGIILRLGSALGSLRLIGVGAPFTGELVKLAEEDIEAALRLARDAERTRSDISTALGEHVAGER
jgi:hypothetical protein